MAWSDFRRTQSHLVTDVYGARVRPDGTVLDPDGIPISNSGVGVGPILAFDGTNYFVAWQDTRSQTRIETYGARVTPGGTVLDPDGIRISSRPRCGGQPDGAIAFDGTNYLVVWCDNAMYGDVYAARVSPAGTVLDPDAIPVAATALNEVGEDLAFDGANYLVVYTVGPESNAPDDVYAARVSPAGTVLDPNGLQVSETPEYEETPSVAFDGTNYLLVWERYFGGPSDIYGARVSPAGSVLDPDGIAVSTIAPRELEPDIAFDGTNFLAVWTDTRLGRDIFGAAITPAGTVLDPQGFVISGDGTPLPPPPRPSPPPPPPPVPARCRVPRVVGLRVGVARTRIRRARCSVGRVRRAHSRRVGRVIGQIPRPGAVKRRGYPVSVVVGRR